MYTFSIYINIWCMQRLSMKWSLSCNMGKCAFVCVCAECVCCQQCTDINTPYVRMCRCTFLYSVKKYSRIHAHAHSLVYLFAFTHTSSMMGMAHIRTHDKRTSHRLHLKCCNTMYCVMFCRRDIHRDCLNASCVCVYVRLYCSHWKF